MTTDTPSSRDEEIPTPRCDNELAWRDGECVTDALTRHADFARQLERDLIRLSAERETEREELRKVDLVRQNASHAANLWESVAKDRERANEVLRSTIDDLEKEREDQTRSNDRLEEENLSIRATLAERDKELAELKAKSESEGKYRMEDQAFMVKIQEDSRVAKNKLIDQLLAAQTVNGKMRDALKDMAEAFDSDTARRFYGEYWTMLEIGACSQARTALALSPDPTLLDEVKREKEDALKLCDELLEMVEEYHNCNWEDEPFTPDIDGLANRISRLRQSTRETEEKV